MPQPRNLYDILGVSKDASQDEIKKAYRKLAAIYHPDKAGDDPYAAEMFDEISKAYEILSNSEKKALYDRPARKRTFYRSSWRPPGGNNFSANQHASKKTKGRAWQQPENGLNLEDLFGMGKAVESPEESRTHAQNQQRAGQREDGDDISVDVEVPISVAKKGGMVPFEYRRLRRTDGISVQSMLELFHLRIPPNTTDGTVLPVDKMGHCGVNGGRSGDLYCRVQLVADPEGKSDSSVSINREQRASEPRKKEVDAEIAISFPEAVFGTRLPVETPSGRVLIAIPPRSSSGRKLRLRGKGKNGADFILSVAIVIPKELDQESLDIVQSFAERNPMPPREN